MTIHFVNPGDLDVRLVKSFGVNVKADDNAIGFFGTGLKYAIAVLLRHGCTVKLYTSDDVYWFSVQPATIRGKEFYFVYMDDEQLGFTTELGKNWELWMAYRELWSNCKDEGGEVFEGSVESVDGPMTCFAVEGAAFEQVHRQKHEFLCTDAPEYVLKNVSLHGPNYDSKNSIFYQGIKVFTPYHPTLYRYNLTTKVDLTEDRTLKYEHQAEEALVKSVLTCTDKTLLKKLLTAPEGTYEYGLEYVGWGGSTPMSDTFKEVMQELIATDLGSIVPSAHRLYTQRVAGESEPEESSASNELRDMYLNDAIIFCTDMGYPVDNYPIKIVSSLKSKNRVYGMAAKGTIYISEAAFEAGQKTVVGTLLEEYFHLRHGYNDHTHEFQDFLVNALVTMGEKHLRRRA